MLASNHQYTLDEVLESLNVFIEAHFERHMSWFHPEQMAEFERDQHLHHAKNSTLVAYTTKLYPYVFNQSFDLTNTDFYYDPQSRYPYCDVVESLQTAVYHTFYFWQSFVGDDFFNTVYLDSRASAFTALAVDAYLRYRADFGSSGGYSRNRLILADDPTVTVDPEQQGTAEFTVGELAHLSGIDLEHIRTQSKTPFWAVKQTKVVRAPIKPGNTGNGSKKSTKIAKEVDVEIVFPPFTMPDELTNFFHGKISSGTSKRLVMHADVVTLLAMEGNYKPCQFFTDNSPGEIEIPDYSNSAVIYQAIERWLSKETKGTMSGLLAYINALNSQKKSGKNKFQKKMADGDARLSLPLVARINNYMLGVGRPADDDTPFKALLENM